jgi:hypothetical protein
MYVLANVVEAEGIGRIPRYRLGAGLPAAFIIG